MPGCYNQMLEIFFKPSEVEGMQGPRENKSGAVKREFSLISKTFKGLDRLERKAHQSTILP